jgi:uncharacterized membrane protein
MNELLLRLQEHGILSAEALQDLENRSSHVPGWLAALQGIAAWVAASMMIVACLVLFGGDFNNLTSGIYGVFLMGVAVFLFYRKDSLFFSQLALAFSLAGQAMLMLAFGEGNDNVAYLLGAFIAAAMTLPKSTLLHRSLCSLLTLGYLSTWFFFVSNHGAYNDLVGIPRLEILGLLFAVLSIALWLSRERWSAHKQAVRFKALVHAGMLMNFGIMGYLCVFQSLLASLQDYQIERLGVALNLPTYSWGAVLLFLATCIWLSRKLPLAQRALLGGVALVLAAAAFTAPWLLVCASLSLASFYACHKGWFALSLVVAVWFLGQFYYNLELTLLAKSGLLALSGGVLLALRVVLHYWQRKPA